MKPTCNICNWAEASVQCNGCKLLYCQACARFIQTCVGCKNKSK